MEVSIRFCSHLWNWSCAVQDCFPEMEGGHQLNLPWKATLKTLKLQIMTMNIRSHKTPSDPNKIARQSILAFLPAVKIKIRKLTQQGTYTDLLPCWPHSHKLKYRISHYHIVWIMNTGIKLLFCYFTYGGDDQAFLNIGKPAHGVNAKPNNISKWKS